MRKPQHQIVLRLSSQASRARAVPASVAHASKAKSGSEVARGVEDWLRWASVNSVDNTSVDELTTPPAAPPAANSTVTASPAAASPPEVPVAAAVDPPAGASSTVSRGALEAPQTLRPERAAIHVVNTGTTKRTVAGVVVAHSDAFTKAVLEYQRLARKDAAAAAWSFADTAAGTPPPPPSPPPLSLPVRAVATREKGPAWAKVNEEGQASASSWSLPLTQIMATPSERQGDLAAVEAASGVGAQSTATTPAPEIPEGRRRVHHQPGAQARRVIKHEVAARGVAGASTAQVVAVVDVEVAAAAAVQVRNNVVLIHRKEDVHRTTEAEAQVQGDKMGAVANRFVDLNHPEAIEDPFTTFAAVRYDAEAAAVKKQEDNVSALNSRFEEAKCAFHIARAAAMLA